MANSIFYSWQSDAPAKTNRNFIEGALEKAIKDVGNDLEVEEALRDEGLYVDKDTKGVPGIPPIVDVIFKKITACLMFVPDLSFVGETSAGRKLPNPNVLIEYGWALREVSHSRIVPIMNTAFGEPTSQSLPFDMRHLRFPITYHLEENASSTERSEVRKQLVQSLAGAIKLIIKNSTLHDTEDKNQAISHIEPTFKPSAFFEQGEPIGQLRYFNDPPVHISLPDVESIFLRLIPLSPIPDIGTKTTAQKLMEKGQVWPMGQHGGQYGRNKFGAFVCNYAGDQTTCITQLFLNGELWGIDAGIIDKERHKKWHDVEFGYFPCVSFEDTFLAGMGNYLEFAKMHLSAKFPMKFIAGAADVAGFRMAAPPRMHFGAFDEFGGDVVDQHIKFEGMIEDWEKTPTEILRPFFDFVWEECGLERPDQDRLGN